MMQLKNLKLKTCVIQSPMAGCTDLAFRLMAKTCGLELAFLEMVHCEPLVRGHQKTVDYLKEATDEKPIGAQIVGCHPRHMGEAAAIVEDMGFDILDINLGCPVPKVTGSGGGSALLREPEQTRLVFREVIKRVRRIPVTAKLRLGYTDASGDEAIAIAKIAQEEGLDAITVHGRTRAQRYSGCADWQAIKRIKQAIQIPVIGNGDIRTAEDAVRAMRESGVDGIMIGRGGLGTPWLYRQIGAALSECAQPPRPSAEDRIRFALEHLRLQVELEPEKVAILKSRRFINWYLKEIPYTAAARNEICRSQSVAESEQILNQLLENS